MKKDRKVVHLKPEMEPVTGVIVPHSIALTQVFFEFAPDDDESDFTADMPQCEMNVEIVGHNDEDDLMMVWDLNFEHPGLFILEASYQALVETEGYGAIDEEKLGKEVSFPIFSEFSLLLANLSRISTGLAYMFGPVELFDLVWDLGLDDLDL